MPPPASPPSSQAPLDAWDALELGVAGSAPAVVAIVGGGGKTSLLFALGRAAAARGVSAVLSGTTRFTRPPGAPPLVVTAQDAAIEVAAALERDSVVVATTGEESQGRLAALTLEEADGLARLPGLGLLALEADGSRMRAFKAPGDHEPVIPPSATHVVVVVGADAIGAPLDEASVHRPERVRVLLGGPVERCTVEVVARVLLHPEGGRKHVEERTFAVLINKADVNPEDAAALARALIESGAPRVVVASLRDPKAPIRAVLLGGEQRLR